MTRKFFVQLPSSDPSGGIIKVAKLFKARRTRINTIDGFKEREAYALFAPHRFSLSTATGIDNRRANIMNLARIARYGNKKNFHVYLPEGTCMVPD